MHAAEIKMESLFPPPHGHHFIDLHSFCDMQLRDAKERESTWKKIRTGIEKQNTDLKTVIQEKEKELQLADDKIRELVSKFVVGRLKWSICLSCHRNATRSSY